MPNAYLTQSLYPTPSFPTETWRQDTALETPELVSPTEGENVCPQNTSGEGNNSNIELTWNAVPGATFYILQFCDNGSFNGPTLRSMKVATNSYNLKLITDVRLGQQLHWRVMAYNGTGGVSAKSEARSFKYECPGGEGKNPSPGDGGGGRGNAGGGNGGNCGAFGVQVEVRGQDTTMCCDKVFYGLKMSFKCKDAAGNATLVVDGVVWDLQQPFDGGTTIEADMGVGGVLLKMDCLTSRTIKLVAWVTFRIVATNQQFQCRAEKKIVIDCHRGKPYWKPWAQIDYKGIGMQTYMHPAYRGDIIGYSGHVEVAPTYTHKDKTLIPIQDLPAGKPEKQALLAGPVVWFKEEEFVREKDKCKIDPGNSVGEMHQARTHLPLGCGLKRKDGKLVTDMDDLVGKVGERVGLEVLTDCKIEVAPGCGINVVNEKVVFWPSEVVWDGLMMRTPGSTTDCKIQVKYGCGLKIGESKELKVDNTKLIGPGLLPSGTCGLQVYPCACGGLEVAGGCVKVDLAIASTNTIWSLDPGSVHLTADKCKVYLTMSVQEIKIYSNCAGVVIGVAQGASTTVGGEATLDCGYSVYNYYYTSYYFNYASYYNNYYYTSENCWCYCSTGSGGIDGDLPPGGGSPGDTPLAMTLGAPEIVV